MVLNSTCAKSNQNGVKSNNKNHKFKLVLGTKQNLTNIYNKSSWGSDKQNRPKTDQNDVLEIETNIILIIC